MAARTRITKQKSWEKEAKAEESTKKAEEEKSITDESDDLLDEIDGLLEDQEVLVKFRQRGGQMTEIGAALRALIGGVLFPQSVVVNVL